MADSRWKRHIHWAFVPAIAALVLRWHASSRSTQLMAAALALFAIEQAWMARVDLLAEERVRHAPSNNALSLPSQQAANLRHFHRIVLATIAGELCGFYTASLHLGWGAVGVFISLIGFNVFVPVRLVPNSPEPIRSIPRSDRLTLTTVDIGVLGLVASWMMFQQPTAIAVVILGCVFVFGLAKYGAIAWKTAQNVRNRR